MTPPATFELCRDKQWSRFREVIRDVRNNPRVSEETLKYAVVQIKSEYPHEWNALHFACKNEAPDDIIHTLIEIGGRDILFWQGPKSGNPLHLACGKWFSSYRIIKLLVDAGGKDIVMSKTNESIYTALHLILYSDPNKNHKDFDKKVALMLNVGGVDLFFSQALHSWEDEYDENKREDKLVRSVFLLAVWHLGYDTFVPLAKEHMGAVLSQRIPILHMALKHKLHATRLDLLASIFPQAIFFRDEDGFTLDELFHHLIVEKCNADGFTGTISMNEFLARLPCPEDQLVPVNLSMLQNPNTYESPILGPPEGFHPFMFAALCGCDTSSIYDLIRLDPSTWINLVSEEKGTD